MKGQLKRLILVLLTFMLVMSMAACRNVTNKLAWWEKLDQLGQITLRPREESTPVETPVEVPEEKPAEKVAEAVVIKPQAPKKDQAAANAQAKIEQIAAKTAANLAKKSAKFEKKQPKTTKPIAKAKVETPEQSKDETNT